jgi:hypothetical protein
MVITDKDEVSSRADRGVADGDLVTLDVLEPETRRATRDRPHGRVRAPESALIRRGEL